MSAITALGTCDQIMSGSRVLPNRSYLLAYDQCNILEKGVKYNKQTTTEESDVNFLL